MPETITYGFELQEGESDRVLECSVCGEQIHYGESFSTTCAGHGFFVGIV